MFFCCRYKSVVEKLNHGTTIHRVGNCFPCMFLCIFTAWKNISNKSCKYSWIYLICTLIQCCNRSRWAANSFWMDAIAWKNIIFLLLVSCIRLQCRYWIGYFHSALLAVFPVGRAGTEAPKSDWRTVKGESCYYLRSKCRMFQKERYNFERVYTFIQRICTVFWDVII
jgi:hypothetical protein